MSITQGAHHIGFTVPDIAATRDFFVDVLQFKQIHEKPDYPAVFVSDGTIVLTLWQASDPSNVVPFDRKNNIGLHHFSLRVESLETLWSMHHTLKSRAGVVIEFAPEPDSGGPSHHMMFYIPGGIRMELFCPST
ncbi:glyoxalase family protein [Synechococcus sp. PCC 7335]|uniref:VOC family protein n=1 Tax=Synechococcus sp. (strain ATCC 29403 / PCC 7335) TaxID=91464 RepID=UPI00017EB0D9|nr:VOC family protein [Synechococcus sp. PCC 7335]EDX86423.1 glyoxalase family protein [Synechococcus sp. PCC 7335]